MLIVWPCLRNVENALIMLSLREIQYETVLTRFEQNKKCRNFASENFQHMQPLISLCIS